VVSNVAFAVTEYFTGSLNYLLHPTVRGGGYAVTRLSSFEDSARMCVMSLYGGLRTWAHVSPLFSGEADIDPEVGLEALMQITGAVDIDELQGSVREYDRADDDDRQSILGAVDGVQELGIHHFFFGSLSK
jgi:hypothetical protein